MNKFICTILAVVCTLSLAACGNDEITATIEPFPELKGEDFAGNAISNALFENYDATIVNFWSNGCGSCIEEMPELEEYFQNFKDRNVNLVAVAVSAGDSEEERVRADEILKEKGVTYQNIIPDTESAFYKDFIGNISGYPITYLVDSDGNMVGAPIIGVVKKQEDALMKRLDEMTK